MDGTLIFLVGSAVLCFGLAIFADAIRHWSNRLTRRLGLHRFTDFRERLWPVLGPIARILLVLAGIGILQTAWKLFHKTQIP